jgi:hypothetical protein
MSWVLMMLAAVCGFQRNSWQLPTLIFIGVPLVFLIALMLRREVNLMVVSHGLGTAIMATASIFAAYGVGWWLARFRPKFRQTGAN